MPIIDIHAILRTMADSKERGGKTVGMNVSLPTELARAVRSTVDGGLYASSSEVIREALRRFFAAPLPPRDAALAERQHAGLDALIEQIRSLPPTQPPNDGLAGSSDHDAVLYGPDRS